MAFFRFFLAALFAISFGLVFVTTAQAYVDELGPPIVRFSEYKPMYFLMGHPDTKIEISLKAQIVEAIPFYFAYTQLMSWELFQSDPYFSDLNYNPEFFYRFNVGPDHNSWLDLSPYEHESNGLGDGQERSWNRVYVRYQWSTHAGEQAMLNWSVKAWIPYWMEHNPDLPQYRGLGELVLTLSSFLGDSWERDDLTLRIYLGGAYYVNPVRGGQELTLRLKSKGRKVLPLLVGQIFRGYGENLLGYQDNHFGLRAGIGF